MAWKNVQYENGKYRTSSGGGGGSSTFADLDDVNFSNLQNGQVPKYNSTTQKWENANESGGGHTYSTTEHVIGTWIDGKPIYEKTVEIGYLPNTNTSIQYPHGISNIKRIISHGGSAINSSGVYLPLPKVSPSGLQYLVDIAVTTSDIVISTGMDRSSYYAYVTLQYTKTTD